MAKVDRRLAKSQVAIKTAVTELMSEKSLLDKIIEEHINNLRERCQSASEITFQEENYVWFEYFECHYLFFSTMLESKDAPYFHSQFLELVIDEYKTEVDITEGKNQGFSEDVILQFFASAIVGVVERKECLCQLVLWQNKRGHY